MFELAANQLPAIYIPYPFAAGDHQYHNAKFLKDKKASFLFRQEEISISKILEIIKLDLEEYSKNLAKINSKNGAKIIVDEILKEI